MMENLTLLSNRVFNRAISQITCVLQQCFLDKGIVRPCSVHWICLESTAMATFPSVNRAVCLYCCLSN